MMVSSCSVVTAHLFFFLRAAVKLRVSIKEGSFPSFKTGYGVNSCCLWHIRSGVHLCVCLCMYECACVCMSVRCVKYCHHMLV